MPAEPVPPPEPAASAPDPPAGWTLPDLRIGRDGEWYEGDVEITHAGILANLRATEGDERTDETVLRVGGRSFTLPRAS
jgi:hypothetical protein